MIKILSSSAGGVGSIPDGGTKISHTLGLKTKKRNIKKKQRRNIVTNSIKTRQMVHNKNLKKEKVSTCHNEDGRSHVLLLRPGANKQIYILKNPKITHTNS